MKANRYPVQILQDFVAFICRSTVASKLDLVKAHHQMPVHPADILKIVVITPICVVRTRTDSFRAPKRITNVSAIYEWDKSLCLLTNMTFLLLARAHFPLAPIIWAAANYQPGEVRTRGPPILNTLNTWGPHRAAPGNGDGEINSPISNAFPHI